MPQVPHSSGLVKRLKQPSPQSVRPTAQVPASGKSTAIGNPLEPELLDDEELLDDDELEPVVADPVDPLAVDAEVLAEEVDAALVELEAAVPELPVVEEEALDATVVPELVE
jgi:hypothetical protein